MLQINKIFRFIKSVHTAILFTIAILCLPAVYTADAAPFALTDGKYGSPVTYPKELDGMALGYMALDVESGTILSEYMPNQNFIPASTLKVITTGVGFLTLGTDFKFKTEIIACGKIKDGVLNGDLVVKGGGDPAFASDLFESEKESVIFETITAMLSQNGISSITGKIIADSNFFGDSPVHQAWNWEDIGNGYGTGVHGLNFAENKFNFKIFKTTDGNISMELPGWTFEIPVNVKLDIKPTGKDPSYVCVFAAPGSKDYVFSGHIQSGKSEITAEAANTRPALLCAHNLYKHLTNSGISINGGYGTGNTPTPAENNKLLGTIYSPDLVSMAGKLNLLSHNAMADAVYKMSGLQCRSEGSFSSGASVTDSILRKAIPDITNFRIVDGSGLARVNAVSPSLFCYFLKAMYSTSIYPSFYKSLCPPESPQYNSMLKGISTRSSLRIKSGGMSGVRCYTGYVKTLKGKIIAFSWMANGFQAPGKKAMEVADIWLKSVISNN